MNKTEILNRLDIPKYNQELIPSLKVNGKQEALGLCPFHNDHNPSLSVNLQSGLFRCFACGAKGDAFTFYQRLKDVDFPTALKEMAEMTGTSTDVKPKVVARFEYRDENGKVLYIKERLEPGHNGRSKEFIFKHLEGDKWVLGRGCDSVLYRLPEITKSKYLFIVEGEGKVDFLNSWGLIATCLDSGANSPWRDEYTKIFEGMEKAVILPDNDTPGRNYAYGIANLLHGKVKELKVLELPGLQEKEDIIDWAKTPGNDKERLLEIVKGASVWIPQECNETTAVNSFNCTDLGNAKRLVSLHGTNIRYCFAWKKWLAWDGKAWSIDNNGQILRLAKDTVKRIYEEAGLISDESQRKAVAKWAVSSESEHRLNAMVSLTQSEPGVPISPDQLDMNPYLLNCLNGTIDLRTGQLKSHDPKDFITKIIPVEYNPKATCPRWIEFLETIFNWNYDLIQYLQRAVGYSLTGDVSEQCLFLLHGTGSNGKSTLLSCLAMLLNDYAQTADFETFLIRKNETIRNDLARMTGKRFISAIETEGERRLAEVLIKQLTGGDMITARFLFGEFFDFRPTFKIWLAANHKPNIRGTDYAIWRRIRLLPFNVTIPENERDPKILEKLKDELPGILAWAVQGCLEWQKNGLQTPQEVKSATDEYKSEMDVIGIFLNECCIVSNDKTIKTTASNLYEAYKKWCEENGEFTLDNRKFGKRLAERGLLPSQSSGKRFWVGIGLREEYR